MPSASAPCDQGSDRPGLRTSDLVLRPDRSQLPWLLQTLPGGETSTQGGEKESHSLSFPQILYLGEGSCHIPVLRTERAAGPLLHDGAKCSHPPDALRKATPGWPSAGSSSAQHIPPLLFSFSPTLNKTLAVVSFISSTALGITYAGSQEMGRGFALLK